jgi:RNA polymerase sigma factor (sigma-70 family)
MASIEEDDELIELMALREDFPDEALQAYGKVFELYNEPMLAIAKKICAKRKDPQMDAEDLVADTFNKVYYNAGSFKKGKLRKKQSTRYAIIGWMISIMKNVFYDVYLEQEEKEKSKQRKEEGYNEYGSHLLEIKSNLQKFTEEEYNGFLEELEEDESNMSSTTISNTEEVDSHNVQIVRDYLETLSERDRDIIRTVYNYYAEGKNTPTEVLDELVNRWSTSKSNIRMILKKFNDSIGQKIESKLHFRITK